MIRRFPGSVPYFASSARFVEPICEVYDYDCHVCGHNQASHLPSMKHVRLRSEMNEKKCFRPLLPSGSPEAVYYRLSETIVSDAMAIIYVCCEPFG